jgi:LuxR family maltose regulon positive regulatory protein
VSGGRPVNSARTTAPAPAPAPASGPARSAVLLPLARARLDRQLTAGLSAPVTVVGAAAGWGKTMCAASWTAAGAGGREVAWVRLDPHDDDPVRFWSKLAAALAQLTGPAAAGAGRRDGAGSGGDPAEAFATAARLVERPVVLVLDDLQLITSVPVHAGLVRFAERPPPVLSLLVLTRRDPPWPLDRLRLAGLVAELSAPDLAFRADEAVELFAGLGLGVDQVQVARLVERTEGWPAGLRLAALQLRGRPDPDAVIDAFSGDHHGVAGYLITEVLAGQPAATVRVLERISVVDAVCPGLVDALTGRADGEDVLAELAAAHLVVPADGRPGRWYHLHRLLGDVLRSRPMPRRMRRDLHRRAAEWFRSAGLPFEAVRSATAGRLWAMAADLVGQHALGLILRGQAGRLEGVLAAVPRKELAGHVELGCCLAGARTVQGSDTEVVELLATARAGLDALADARAVRARLLLDLVEGAVARLHGRWDVIVAVYRAVPRDPVLLARLGLVGAELVPVVLDNMLGLAALLDEDLPTARCRLGAALAVDLSGPALSQLNAAAYLALVLCERGELDAAEERALEVVQRVSATGWEQAVQVIAAHLAMARVAMDRADLFEADDWLGRVARERVGRGEPHVRVLTALVRITRRVAVGQHEEALSFLRATLAPVDLAALPRGLRQSLLVTEATLLARLGDIAGARALLDDLHPPAGSSASLVRARLLLLLGDAAAAAAARRRAEPADHPRARVATGILDSVLALAEHDVERALDRIEDALTAAAPHTLRQPFLWEAAELRPLLERRLERGTVVPGFVVDLLERISGVPGAGDPARAWSDPLTEREHTVLRYLASTLSNAEIAAELYVSVNTVKTHQRALYRKLGVASRRAAVSRARVLDLL